jgi:hypothetical protein
MACVVAGLIVERDRRPRLIAEPTAMAGIASTGRRLAN